MGSEVTPEYRDNLRRLSGEQKLKTAFQLYWSARKLKASFLRQRYPDWSEEKIAEEVKRIFCDANH